MSNRLAMPLLLAAAAFVGHAAIAADPSPRKDSDANAKRASSDADNSKVNARDRNDATTLPTDQPNNEADLELAAAVRAAIVDDDSLSMSAHNVKLVAAAGVVVLRGPVASADEKAEVGRIAAAVRGVSRVENHLDVDAR